MDPARLAAGRALWVPLLAKILLVWACAAGGGARAARTSDAALELSRQSAGDARAASELIARHGEEGAPDTKNFCVVTKPAGGCRMNTNVAPNFLRHFSAVSVSTSTAFEITGQLQHVYEALSYRDLPAKVGEGLSSAHWCVNDLKEEAGAAVIGAIKKKFANLCWALSMANVVGGAHVVGTSAGDIAAGPAGIVIPEAIGYMGLGPVGSAISLLLMNPSKYSVDFDAIADAVLQTDAKKRKISASLRQYTPDHKSIAATCIRIHRTKPCGSGSSQCLVLGEGDGALEVTTKTLATLTAMLVEAPRMKHFSDVMIDAETRAKIEEEAKAKLAEEKA